MTFDLLLKISFTVHCICSGGYKFFTNTSFWSTGPHSTVCSEEDFRIPGFPSSISAWSHTFVEIDHEIISTVVLFLPLIQEELLSETRESICTKGLVKHLVKLASKRQQNNYIPKCLFIV